MISPNGRELLPGMADYIPYDAADQSARVQRPACGQRSEWAEPVTMLLRNRTGNRENNSGKMARATHRSTERKQGRPTSAVGADRGRG